ncbi:hypothetical protein ACLOJK_018988 [Asimina triloba]
MAALSNHIQVQTGGPSSTAASTAVSPSSNGHNASNSDSVRSITKLGRPRTGRAVSAIFELPWPAIVPTCGNPDPPSDDSDDSSGCTSRTHQPAAHPINGIWYTTGALKSGAPSSPHGSSMASLSNHIQVQTGGPSSTAASAVVSPSRNGHNASNSDSVRSTTKMGRPRTGRAVSAIIELPWPAIVPTCGDLDPPSDDSSGCTSRTHQPVAHPINGMRRTQLHIRKTQIQI